MTMKKVIKTTAIPMAIGSAATETGLKGTASRTGLITLMAAAPPTAEARTLTAVIPIWIGGQESVRFLFQF